MKLAMHDMAVGSFLPMLESMSEVLAKGAQATSRWRACWRPCAGGSSVWCGATTSTLRATSTTGAATRWRSTPRIGSVAHAREPRGRARHVFGPLTPAGAPA